MSANHSYDPRYNTKLYVPKLTEEERRARATSDFKNVGP